MKESGIEELRRIVNAAGYTREAAFDGFSAEEVIRIVRACWGSGWDIFPDELYLDEREFAAMHGKLSEACLARLAIVLR